MITIVWWAMKRWVTLTTFDQTDKRDICRGSTLGRRSVGHAEHRSLDRLLKILFFFQRFLAFLWTETKSRSLITPEMKNWRSLFCGQEEFFSRYSDRTRWAQLGQPIRIQDSLYLGGNVTYPLWTKGQTPVRSHHSPSSVLVLRFLTVRRKPTNRRQGGLGTKLIWTQGEGGRWGNQHASVFFQTAVSLSVISTQHFIIMAIYLPTFSESNAWHFRLVSDFWIYPTIFRRLPNFDENVRRCSDNLWALPKILLKQHFLCYVIQLGHKVNKSRSHFNTWKFSCTTVMKVSALTALGKSKQ